MSSIQRKAPSRVFAAADAPRAFHEQSKKASSLSHQSECVLPLPSFLFSPVDLVLILPGLERQSSASSPNRLTPSRSTLTLNPSQRSSFGTARDVRVFAVSLTIKLTFSPLAGLLELEELVPRASSFFLFLKHALMLLPPQPLPTTRSTLLPSPAPPPPTPASSPSKPKSTPKQKPKHVRRTSSLKRKSSLSNTRGAR